MPAWQRLETAIDTLERALAARSTASQNPSDDGLAQRHEALKSSVAACLVDLDRVIAGPVDA